jgi:diguanylate cyclase (GGDEF)-like protein/PAS domain S-box-containing protein
VSRARRRLTILLIVASLSAALLLVQSAAAWKVLSGSFAVLEQRQGERSIDQALKAIEADLNQLAISAHDYAVWDDAFDFVRTRDQHFIESNLTAETLANLRVDFVWMTDTRGVDILSFQRRSGHESGRPGEADAQIIGAMRARLPVLMGRPDTPGLARLFRTKSGLLAVAANLILPTVGHGIPRGTLVFGRFVDQAVVERAQATSQLPLHLYLSAASSTALPEQARALWSLARGERGRVLVPASDTLLSGFELLRDVDGVPVAIVATDIPRNLLSFGRQTGRSLVAIFSGVIAVFAGIVAGLLLYLVSIGEARTASERRYRAVITQAHETMLLVDAQTRRILEANPAATITLGFSTAELLELDIDELFFACDGDVLKPVLAELHATASDDRILIVRSKDKEFIDVEVTVSPLMIDGREVTSFVLRDVSARKRAERQLVHNQDRLAHLAHHDMLTGLLNRLGLERRLPEVIKAAAQHCRGVAFLYVDLDHFKKINDLRGHTCGDKLLRIAADRLRDCLSSNDLVVRMGGDEFVVVAEIRELINAEAIAARIREKLAVPFEVDQLHFKVTASIGVSVYPNDGADYEILLKNADIALYESKEGGRDIYTLFTTEMTHRVSERLAMELELREALQSGQFYLEYQPLLDARTQRIASLEALIRWHHPVRGRVPPLQFIGIAERTGQICEIGAFVIRETCRQLGEWQRAGLRLVPIAVNVSSKQLEQRTMLDVIASALSTTQISPSLLRIEITESVFVDASDRRVEHLHELRRMGVQVSVDDFGTGYSSLAYLKRLPVDCLKIDRAFVRDIDSSSADEAIVKAIIRMAESLGLSTVAEGVETAEQARRLNQLGTTFVQGFYFSPPLAADSCARLLDHAVVSDDGRRSWSSSTTSAVS